MGNIESKRNTWNRVLSVPLRHEMGTEDLSGLQAAEAHLESGHGLIVYANHVDKVDPLLVFLSLCGKSPVFNNTEIVIPIADHQKMNGIKLSTIAHNSGVEIKPIVTSNSRKKYEKKARTGGKIMRHLREPYTDREIAERMAKIPDVKTGQVKFSNDAAEALSGPKIVYLPTQPERESEVSTSVEGERSLGLLALKLKRSRVENVGVLSVGVSLPNVLNPEQHTGFNFFKNHTIRPGEFTFLQDAIERSGGINELDAWMIENKVAPLVSPHHLSPDLRKKIHSL